MKKSLLPLLMCAMLLVACNSDSPYDNKVLKVPHTGTFLAPSDEFKTTLWFTVINGTENDVVEYYTTAEWLTVTDVTTKVEDGNLEGTATCIVSKNDEGVYRKGEVCFVYEYQIIKVFFEQDDSPTLPEPM